MSLLRHEVRGPELAANLATVQDRITRACAAAGRQPEEVTLVVVTKFFPASDVEQLAELGVRHVGESRDQEAGTKIASLPEHVRQALTVHFVGQVQTNKVRRIARYADVVHSVDRARLVTALGRGVTAALDAGARHTPLAVTIQVDLDLGLGDRDSARGGAAPHTVLDLAAAVGAAEHLQLRGLMAVAPLGADQEGTRAAFDRLMDLSGRLRAEHPAATWVSAGMSGDLETAVSVGATHLRVGSAILGSRPPQR